MGRGRKFPPKKTSSTRRTRGRTKATSEPLSSNVPRVSETSALMFLVWRDSLTSHGNEAERRDPIGRREFCRPTSGARRWNQATLKTLCLPSLHLHLQPCEHNNNNGDDSVKWKLRRGDPPLRRSVCMAAPECRPPSFKGEIGLHDKQRRYLQAQTLNTLQQIEIPG